jgi:hypothetical protein
VPTPQHPLPPSGDPAPAALPGPGGCIRVPLPTTVPPVILTVDEDQDEVLAWEMAAFPAADPPPGLGDEEPAGACAPEDLSGTGPGGPDPGWGGDWLPREGADSGDAFRQGGPGDRMPPGPELAELAGRAGQAGLDRLDDDQRAGVLAAAQRLASWAAAIKLSAISATYAARVSQARAGRDWRIAEHVNDEIAITLTLTRRSADRVLSLATGLDRLPLTRAALAAGDIDERRAEIITDELAGLDDAHATEVEARLIGRASCQTTTQLQAAARRAVIAVDPAATRRRKARALQDARVEAFTESAGTAGLAGRDLPPAEVLAADRHLTALALQLRNAGAEGTLDQLRAHVYLHLLAGQPAGALWAGHRETAHPGSRPPRPGPPVLRGTVHLTMPLATWLGDAGEPGQVAGFGPLDADDARIMAGQLARDPANRWCITLTDPAGRPVAHGCARAGPGPPAGPDPPGGPVSPRDRLVWIRQVPIAFMPAAGCTHRQEGRGYQPGPRLRHLVQIRNATCSAPGCQRAATRCDLDHTIPHHLGGRTCACNLGPVCRRDHRLKQAPGWALSQTSPGTFTWTTPAGRSYTTYPTEYPS